MNIGARKQPLYDQLVELLRDKVIASKRPNEILPSERELTERYGVSRTTVRLALRELENLGLVYRRHGKGTFVADIAAQATDLTATYSFTDHMRQLGRTPTSRVIEFNRIEANKYLAMHLNIRLGSPVHYMRRLRLADDVPMMVERTYIPVRSFMALTRFDVESRPLYEIIEQEYGKKIRVAEEEFSAGIVRSEEAEQLGLPAGSPVLRFVRTTFSDSNEIVEFTTSAARADKFKYKILHYRR